MADENPTVQSRSPTQLNGKQLFTDLVIEAIGGVARVWKKIGMPLATMMDGITTAAAVHHASGVIAFIQAGDMTIAEAVEMIEGSGEAAVQCSLAHFFDFCDDLGIDIPEEVKAKRPKEKDDDEKNSGPEAAA